MIKKYSLIGLLALGLSVQNQVFGQEYPRQEIELDRFVENLFQLQDASANYEDMYESLLLLYTNPLNLNTADREDLASLYVLSEAQINGILSYRAKYGNFLSVYELQAVSEMDMNTIYNLMPFTYVRDDGFASDGRPLWQRIKTEKNHTLIVRYSRSLEQQKGYTPADTNSQGQLNQRYLGKPDKWFARYRINHPKDFSLGFTMEKDAGEQFTWNPDKKQYGFDFMSAHLFLENKGRWKKIAIGDYQVQFGQGLVLSAGFAVGKGAETVGTVRRSSLGIKPFTSVLEGTFFRGAAATYNVGRVDITAFASHKKIDGSVQTATDTIDNDNVENYISSVNITGFHRTPTELAKKHSTTEDIAGANAIYHSKDRNLELGVLATGMRYSVPLQRDATSYNQFTFSGKQNSNASVAGSYNWQNFNFFGEAAVSENGGKGVVTGFMSSLSPKVEMAMVYRNYSRDYHAIYSNAFGEATMNTNEQGVYWGLKIRPIKKWTLAVYYDRFKFPWLSYQADAPAEGNEYLARLTYQPSRSITIFGQFRSETKGRNLTGNDTRIDYLVPTTRRNYAINLDYKAPEYISFKTRVQWSSWEQENRPRTQGYAIIQDITLKPTSRLDVSVRMAIFQTDDYNNRQYAYEKNVLYAFAIPAYYGRGTRAYLLANYGITRRLEMWLRIARTHYRDVNTVGSGLEEKKGNKDTDLVVQLRYKFG